MPLRAVRGWHDVEWKTSLEVQKPKLLPAVIMTAAGVSNMSNTYCHPGDFDVSQCNTTDIRFLQDYSTGYWTFSPLAENGKHVEVAADFGTTYLELSFDFQGMPLCF
jgi:hypothetical protein